VPGRRPRPAPVVVEPAGRRERWRDAARGWAAALLTRRAAVVGLAVLTLTGLGWALLGAPGGDHRGAGAAAVTAPSVRPEPEEAADTSSVEQQIAPATTDEWRAVLEELYRRRAEAFATASPGPLDQVYAEGSPLLEIDAGLVARLSGSREVLRGFVPTVQEVTAVETDGDRVRLDLVDSWAPYEVVPAARPDGEAVGTGPGRTATGVRMVLVRAGDRWLIESAERAG
jgi:hypothetical protein